MRKITTIRLDEADRAAIAKIKARYGIASDSDAIRLAFRLLAESKAECQMIQAKLREIVARGRSDQHALIAALSDAERSAVGEPDRWSPKDHLAHMNFWRRRTLAHMDAAEQDEGVPAYPDDGEVQQLNAQTFAEQRLIAWDDIVA
ncbi:MAG: DinB family protein, partial [Pseudomonadota bacterium]